jgi:hypothetical protein
MMLDTSFIIALLGEQRRQIPGLVVIDYGRENGIGPSQTTQNPLDS